MSKKNRNKNKILNCVYYTGRVMLWLLKLTEYLPVSYAAMWKNSSLAWNIKKKQIMRR